MKDCPKCNAANPDDAVYCSNCGSGFEGASLPGGPDLVPPQEAPGFPPPGQPAQMQPGGQAPYPPPGYQYIPPGYPRYAGFWIRFAASLIDAVVVSLAFLPINVIFSAINSRIPIYIFVWGFWIWPEGVDTQLLVFFNLARLAVLWAYFIIMTASTGATLGKRVLKLRVVRDDMSRVSYGTAALRETIGKTVSLIPCALGFIWAGFDARKQAWHDKIAHTFVIITGP